MTRLLDTLKARRRLLAPLIWLGVASGDHLVGGGEMVRFCLIMAGVSVIAYAPAKYFQYHPRGRK